jgi:hypothetical protein
MFNLKSVQKLKYLLTSEASRRGCVRHLRADFISPVLAQLAPFPECLSPGVSPGVYTARLAAKLLFAWTAHLTIAGVSTEEIR